MREGPIWARKPETKKGHGLGLGRPKRPFWVPGPIPGPGLLGSLAHMVPGPWAPGPYLQGRNMTFGIIARFIRILENIV